MERVKLGGFRHTTAMTVITRGSVLSQLATLTLEPAEGTFIISLLSTAASALILLIDRQREERPSNNLHATVKQTRNGGYGITGTDLK
jgi:hypothetical protein